MRISDWSSDVCSSYLSDDDVRIPALDPFHAAKNDPKMEGAAGDPRSGVDFHILAPAQDWYGALARPRRLLPHFGACSDGCRSALHGLLAPSSGEGRPEEHTSDLTSLMRISYSAFC